MRDYGITVRTALPFAEAAARVRNALKEQGFGVLTEIDAQATAPPVRTTPGLMGGRPAWPVDAA